jgi:hypothetical protein
LGFKIIIRNVTNNATPFYLSTIGKKMLKKETFRDEESATHRTNFHIDSGLPNGPIQKILNAKPMFKKSRNN